MSTAQGLRVADVTVRVGGVTAVRGAALTVPPGTVAGLVGPDGAGRATLCDVIAGLRRPAEGTVHLGDADLTGSAARERARRGIARTSREPARWRSRTVHESVRAAARRHAALCDHGGRTSRDRWARRRRARGEAGDRADELLARVGIAEFADLPERDVPPGVARLTGLARALAAEPAVLLLDDPWEDLPERRARALEVLLRDLAAEGVAVLVAERDLEPVLGVCDVLHVLDGGRVIAAGPPAEVRADPCVRAAYLAGPAPVTRCPPSAAAGPRWAVRTRTPW